MCSSWANSYLIKVLKADLEYPPTGYIYWIRAKWYKILGSRGAHNVNVMQREAHMMWADLGLGLANHRCQVSVFKFQISSMALLPTIDILDRWCEESPQLWCCVWDTLCPYLDITYACLWTWPKTDIRLSKNRHKPCQRPLCGHIHSALLCRLEVLQAWKNCK